MNNFFCYKIPYPVSRACFTFKFVITALKQLKHAPLNLLPILFLFNASNEPFEENLKKKGRKSEEPPPAF